MADIVTNGGKAVWTDAMNSFTTRYLYGYWGTGSGQTATSTDLATKAAPTTTTAVTGTSSRVTTTVTNDTYQVVATITAGSTLAITEFGLTTNATIASGTLSAYHDFSAINVVSGDSVEFTHKTRVS